MNRHLSSTVNPVISYIAIGVMVIIFFLIVKLVNTALASEAIFTNEQTQIGDLSNSQ